MGKGKTNLFLCAIIKNEHYYIREWVDYHLSIGVDKIYLYDNESSHGYEEELGDLIDSKVFIKYWSNTCTDEMLGHRNKQILAYQDFVSSKKWTNNDWGLFLDVDEFLCSDNKDFDLKKYLWEISSEISLILPFWKIYNANGHIEKQKNVLESYKNPAPFGAYISDTEQESFKSLVRLSKCIEFKSVHLAIVSDGEKVMPNLKAVELVNAVSATNISYETFYIKHFYTKSMEDWANRLFRGQVTINGKMSRTALTFFKYNPDLANKRRYFNDLLLKIRIKKEQENKK